MNGNITKTRGKIYLFANIICEMFSFSFAEHLRKIRIISCKHLQMRTRTIPAHKPQSGSRAGGHRYPSAGMTSSAMRCTLAAACSSVSPLPALVSTMMPSISSISRQRPSVSTSWAEEPTAT